MDRGQRKCARSALWGFMLAVLVTTASTAMAESGDPAEALLRRGVELRKAGHDDQALDAFRSAYQMKATPRARAQIGLAEQALGHWVDAESDLKGALAAQSDPWISRNLAALERSVAVVAAHLGSVQIVGSPVGARVMLDERDAGKLPLESHVRAPAGEVLVKVSAPGFVDISRKLMVVAGGMVRESIVLQPANPLGSVATKSVPESRGQTATADDHARPTTLPALRSTPVSSTAEDKDAISGQGSHLTNMQIWGVAAAAVGVVGAGVGTLFMIQAISKNNESRSAGCMGDACGNPGEAAYDARVLARKDGDRATVAFAASGVLVAGGLTLFLIGRHSADSSSAAHIIPVVGPGRFAMMGTVRF